MNYKLATILCLATFALGSTTSYFLYPKIEYKMQTETKTQTQLQVKTVVKTIEKPDGTKITEQTTTDNTVINQASQTTEQKISKSKYLLGVGAGSKLSDFSPTYSISGQMRVFGPVFAGAYGRTDGEFGVLVSLEF